MAAHRLTRWMLWRKIFIYIYLSIYRSVWTGGHITPNIWTGGLYHECPSNIWGVVQLL